MTIVMTLLVRDEADVVEAHLDFHLAMGVDFVIATDNRSVDGTTDVLRRYEKDGVLRYLLEEDDDYAQARWVTRMARLAAAEHGADWVLNSDADELWLPRRGGDLVSALDAVPPTDDVVVVPRTNVLAVPPVEGEPFHRWMTVRHAEAGTSPEEGRPVPPKVAHRAHELVAVSQGNHDATWPGVGDTLDEGPLEILHFPHRSREQLEHKIEVGGAAYARNEELPPEVGDRWRQLYAEREAGRFGEVVDALFHDDPEEVREGLAEGRYVEDRRVTDLLDRIAPEKAIRVVGRPEASTNPDDARVLRVLRTTADRSAGSDALAHHVADWPSRRELSALRANLVAPLALGPGMRVLHVGAGTGSVTRAIAETGAEVVAVEPVLERARATAVRCAGLDGVQVVCGPFAEVADDGFDVVVSIGELERAGEGLASHEVDDAAAGHVAALAARLAPDGLVVLATENRLGLKYLLGYAEHELGEPYVGVEGYGGRSVRTWGRGQVAAMLDAAGLERQRWLHPFPDATLPRTLVASEAYEQPDPVRLVDAVVHDPCSTEPEPPLRLADERKAHAAFVAAGIGPDVAGAFLVVAGGVGAAPERLVDPDLLAWSDGAPRLRAWRRTQVLRRTADGVEAVGTPRADTATGAGWLRVAPASAAPLPAGPTVEQLLLGAAGDHDDAAAAEVLGAWRAAVEAQATPVAEDERTTAAYRPLGTTHVVPPELLDAGLRRWVRTDDGTLAFLGGELEAADGADVQLVLLRALYEQARHLVVTGSDHPWGRRLTVGQLTVLLGELAGVAVDTAAFVRWRAAELELQRTTTGQDPAVLGPLLEAQADLARTNPKIGPRLPMTTLRSDLRKAEKQRHAAEQEAVRLRDELDAAEAERDRLRDELDRWDGPFGFVRNGWPGRAYRRLRDRD